MGPSAPEVARVGRTLLSVAFGLACELSTPTTTRARFLGGAALPALRNGLLPTSRCHSEPGRRPGEEPAVDFDRQPLHNSTSHNREGHDFSRAKSARK